jgi:hypothetical protein
MSKKFQEDLKSGILPPHGKINSIPYGYENSTVKVRKNLNLK